jgi:hypothetical protein
MAQSHPILGIYQPFYGWYIQVVYNAEITLKLNI